MHHLSSSRKSERRTYEVVEVFEDAGIPVVQSGSYKRSEFWYFDTAEVLNGLVFETSIRRNEAWRSPESVYSWRPFSADTARGETYF